MTTSLRYPPPSVVPILTMFTGTGGNAGFTLVAQPSSVTGPYGSPYNWQFMISATGIGSWTGQVDLTESDNLPAGAAVVSFENPNVNVNSNTPTASTLLYVVISSGITIPGTYTVTITGVDDETGLLTNSCTITIVIPTSTGQSGPPCQEDSDCTSGQVCVDSTCQNQCYGDQDCGPGGKCVQAPGKATGIMVCQSPGELLMTCSDVTLPQDGTQITVPIANIKLPGPYWTPPGSGFGSNGAPGYSPFYSTVDAQNSD